MQQSAVVMQGALGWIAPSYGGGAEHPGLLQREEPPHCSPSAHGSSSEHDWPSTPGLGACAQTPLLQTLLQQSESRRQASSARRHPGSHFPPVHRMPAQQSSDWLQTPPEGLHAHNPSTQAKEQHCALSPQFLPGTRQSETGPPLQVQPAIASASAPMNGRFIRGPLPGLRSPRSTAGRSRCWTTRAER